MAKYWRIKGFLQTFDSIEATEERLRLGDASTKMDVIEELNRRFGFRRYDKKPMFEPLSITEIKNEQEIRKYFPEDLKKVS